AHVPLLSFLFNAPAPTEIYTLSLHDALPISLHPRPRADRAGVRDARQSRCAVVVAVLHSVRFVRQVREIPALFRTDAGSHARVRSEEHTSELQSLTNLVCRLLLEKKKNRHNL